MKYKPIHFNDLIKHFCMYKAINISKKDQGKKVGINAILKINNTGYDFQIITKICKPSMKIVNLVEYKDYICSHSFTYLSGKTALFFEKMKFNKPIEFEGRQHNQIGISNLTMVEV